MKLVEITPKEFQCGFGACPAVFETDRGTYIIVGRDLTDELPPELSGRVSAQEKVVEIRKELLIHAF